MENWSFLNDERIVIGYIEQLFKSKQFKNSAHNRISCILPPVYIMRYIAKWYSEETIHWVTKYRQNVDKTKKHFAVSLKYILDLTITK